ncbi:MAG: sugar transferase [Alphaproteobacteria bacterium]|nr:sugar transferase [Alphaproteobacteria bacterium]
MAHAHGATLRVATATSSDRGQIGIARASGLPRSPGYHLQRFAKGLLDAALAATMLAVLVLPLAALLAAVARDGAWPLFAHRRIGQGGRPFRCWKIRTMAPDAERRLAALLAADPAARAEWRRDQKLRRDPRVTPLGAFLRRTSIDELPQLWNVLRGEMSLVGPRPITAEEAPRYGSAIEHYLAVRPGLTGLWQVSGRSDANYESRISLDTRYVTEWSLLCDLRILARTPIVLLTGRGAC